MLPLKVYFQKQIYVILLWRIIAETKEIFILICIMMRQRWIIIKRYLIDIAGDIDASEVKRTILKIYDFNLIFRSQKIVFLGVIVGKDKVRAIFG
jgi:hypothetical protein